MSQHKVETLTLIFDELNEFRKRLQGINAKYDELQVDCATMVTAMRKVLSTEASNSTKLYQIGLVVGAFPERHLTRNDENTNKFSSKPGTIKHDHAEFIAVI